VVTLPRLLRSASTGAVDASTTQWRSAAALSVGLCLATAILVWLAYIATREWRRDTDLLQERRVAETLALAHAALVRDLKGAWVSFLVPVEAAALEDDPPYELLHRSAQTFAKFPYVDSIIVWRADAAAAQTYAFVRSDRPPVWDHASHGEDSFPVLMLRDPLPFGEVIDVLRRPNPATGPFLMLETSIAGTPYQVVAHTILRDARSPVRRIVALVINLDWVRRYYFAPILAQIASIGGVNDAVTLSVLDDSGQMLARAGPAVDGRADSVRSFPFVFLESAALRNGTTAAPAVRSYSVHAQQAPGTEHFALVSIAFRVLLLTGVASAASIAALFQTMRAVRGSVRLATMKSEFVSAVTHELKTPLVTIRLVGDTLARGRYGSNEAVQEYARMLSDEAVKLGQSIDQLLTYAHYSEPMPLHALGTVDVSDIIDDAVDRFQTALGDRNASLTVDTPRGLPQVRVDARAIIQALEIALDNAIKHSDGTPSIAVSARQDRSSVVITISDEGIGIHPDDLGRVRERFFRGRNAHATGSGLGLAIAARILEQNGGEMRIESELGTGTRVELVLRTGQS
jgi:signal transduction histidine kinase